MKTTKYCFACGKFYESIDPKFKYCPECGRFLLYGDNLELIPILNQISNMTRKFCYNCKKEFKKEYNFCPICSKKLEEEKIFEIDFLREHIIGQWNDGDEKFSFGGINPKYLINADPMPPAFYQVFESKLKFDEIFENDMIIFEQPITYKLSYQHVFSIISSLSMINYFERVVDEYHFLIALKDFKGRDIFEENGFRYLSLGKDLYLIFNPLEDIKSFIKKYPLIDRCPLNREQVLEIVDQLIELKDYFENPPIDTLYEDGGGCLCNCEATDKILKLLYDNEIDDTKYIYRLPIMKAKYKKSTAEGFSKEKLTFKEIIAVLTGLTRAERHGGAFFKAIEDKTFYNLLSRLREIRDDI